VRFAASSRPWVAAAPLVATLATLVACAPTSFAARMILEPNHERVRADPVLRHESVEIAGDGVVLRGWLFHAEQPHRGVIIFLHGRNQNREAALVVAKGLLPLGYDVLAYDSRAHGESDGQYSTFGYYEKGDLRRAIDYLGVDRVLIIGVSLGAAVALQAAAEDARIVGVVAISSFSTMEEIVRDQIPPFVPRTQLEAAFREVERRAHMDVKSVDTVEAARAINVPVLLLHGTSDRFTSPEHSRRIYDALPGPRALVLVDGAHHADVLSFRASWRSIFVWLGRLPLHGARSEPEQLTSSVRTSTRGPIGGEISMLAGKRQATPGAPSPESR
jgi:uncharacterized protein